MIRTLLALLATLILTSHANISAQEPERIFTVTLKSIALDNSIMNLWLQEDGKAIAFQVSNSRISPPVTLSTTGALTFYEKVEGAEEGQPTFIPVAQTTITPEYRNYLLIFNSTGSKSGSESRYLVLPVGRVYRSAVDYEVEFLNFSSFPVACRINNRDFVLNRAEGKKITPTPDEEMNLGLRMAKKDGEDWSIGFNSVWRHRIGFNTLILIVDHPRREGAISAKRLYDDIPRESQADGADDN